MDHLNLMCVIVLFPDHTHLLFDIIDILKAFCKL